MALTTGSTVRLYATATRDGSTWDLTAATVTLYLTRPDGTQLTKTATITSAATGAVEYTTLTTDLSQAGTWRYAWRVVQDTVTAYSEPDTFQVVAAP